MRYYTIKLKENNLYAVVDSSMPFKIFDEQTGQLLYRSGLVSTHLTEQEAIEFSSRKNLRNAWGV